MRQPFTAKQAGFTLVEIIIVVAIIALLAAIAVPGFLRARKRSQASRISHDVRSIGSAVDQYAIGTGKKSSDPVAVSDWTNYLKKDTNRCVTDQNLFGHDQARQTVDSLPMRPTPRSGLRIDGRSSTI